MTDDKELTPIERFRKSSGEAIRKAREDLGWTQTELAEKAETTQQTVDRIERGATLNSKASPRILKALGLSSGKGPSADMAERAIADIFESADVGPGSESFVKFMQEGRAISKLNDGDHLPVFSQAAGGLRLIDAIPRIYPVMLVKDAYALIVSDSDMSPAIRPGDIVVVNPLLPVQAGCEVIVTLRQDNGINIFTRTLTSDEGDFWTLKTWSPSHTATIGKDEYVKLEMIVAKLSRYR